MIPVVLLLFIIGAHARPEGAPTTLCQTMVPFHGNGIVRQQGPSPYSIKTLRNQGDVVVTIKSSSEIPLQELILQARIRDGELAGAFETSYSDVQAIGCIQVGDTITHSHPRSKAAVEVRWKPPIGYVGPVTFNATVAQDYSTLWVGIESETLRISKRVQDDGTVEEAPSRSKAANSSHYLPAEKTGSNVKTDSIYQGCGEGKLCFGTTSGCLDTQDCRAVVAITGNGDRYQFEMMAVGSPGWVGVGLSTDNQMGDDSVIECSMDSSGTGKAYLTWTTPRPNLNAVRIANNQEGITLVSSSADDGTIYCKVLHDAKTTINDVEFDLANTPYYILIAAGSDVRESGPGYHNIGRLASDTSMYLSNVKTDSFYEGCGGEDKLCFGSVDGCVDTQDCAAVVAITVSGDRYQFEMKAVRSPGWVGVGLSTDNQMGDDSVIECSRDSSGTVKAYLTWTTPRPNLNAVRIDNNQEGITLVSSSTDDGIIYCKVLHDAKTATNGVEFDLVNTPYYILIAAGSDVRENGPGYHDIGRLASDTSMYLSNAKTDSFYEGCGGEDKLCFGTVDGCVDTQDCTAVVAITVSGDHYQFEMKAVRSPGWVGVGLSTDNQMGDDSVIECSKDNSGMVKAYLTWTTPRPNLNAFRIANNPEGITLVSSSADDDTIYCKVLHDAKTTINGVEFDLVNTPYYILIGAGSDVSENGPGYHDIGRLASDTSMYLSNVKTDSFYEGCGEDKLCFGTVDGCVDTQDCRAVVAITVSGDRYQFEMRAVRSPGWVGVGLSTDNQMGDDSVIECSKDSSGMVKAYLTWTTPRPNLNAFRIANNQEGITLVSSSADDDTISCTVLQDAKTTINGVEFDLVNTPYYILIAAGSDVRENGPGYHDIGRLASDTSMYLANEKTDSFYEGCGEDKLCFGTVDGCVDTQDCRAVVAITVSGDRYQFEMKAVRSPGWVGVGLSPDNQMGNDSVIECSKDSSGMVKAYLTWTTPRPNLDALRIANNQEGITLVSSSADDDTIYCKVLHDAKTTINGVEFDLVNTPYYILIAAGSDVRENGPGYHDIGGLASDTSRYLSDISPVMGASKILLRLHGAFMLAAWVGTASLGTFIARYYRKTWVLKTIWGKDLWFAWHRCLMVLTWVLTTVAFILIFVELKAWSTENPHSILGCIVTALCFMQPIGAFFRPHPGTPKRPVFNWMHWLGGNAAHIIAIIAIFFAVRLTKAELPQWFDWILIAFIAFHVLMHLVLSILSSVADNSSNPQITDFPTKSLNTSRKMSADMVNVDAPYSGARKLLLALYFIVVVGLTAGLIIVAVLAPIGET